MKTVKSFLSSLVYAVNLIIKKKLYAYFSLAILVSILFYFMFSGGQSLSNSMSFMEDWWVIGWVIKSFESFFGFLSFMIFEFFILILLSPINAILAEKVREDITGETLAFSMAVFLKSLRRMIVIIIMGLILQLLLMLVLWLFSFLLGDWFFEIASLLNIAFFIGFSFFDFGLELDEVNSRKSWKYARKNWLACIILGLVFNVGIYYPQKHDLMFLYVIAIAILPHLLAIAATKMYYNSIGEKAKQVSADLPKQVTK